MIIKEQQRAQESSNTRSTESTNAGVPNQGRAGVSTSQPDDSPNQERRAMRDDGWRDRWAPIELGALSEMTGNDCKVLVALAGLGFIDGQSWPGFGLLAEITGLSKREVIRCLERLQGKGDTGDGKGDKPAPFVAQVGPSQRGRGHTNTYKVLRGVHRAPTREPQELKGARAHPLAQEKVTLPNRTSRNGNNLRGEEKYTSKRDDDAVANQGGDNPTLGPCPDCGGRLLVRDGPHGEFVGCSSYPRCAYRTSLPKPLLSPEFVKEFAESWGQPREHPPEPPGEPIRDGDRMREIKLAAQSGGRDD